MKAFYGSFIGPMDLCFDIGANLGNRTRVFLELDARVIAAEPHPYCLRVLRAKYGRDPRLTVVPKAVGRIAAEAEMAVGESHTISTLSTEWRDHIVQSGRWRSGTWTRSIRVQVTTLDALVAEFGVPKFCKIDVEGFELEVLAGLSTPLPALSFEFTAPEENEKAVACIDALERLGRYDYNYSLTESMAWASPEWMPARSMASVLLGLREADSWGDVYARLA